MRISFFLTALLSTSLLLAQPQTPVRPVKFSDVIINDAFWKPKLDLVATATLQACIMQTEEKTGRIRNFEKVARGRNEAFEGIFYDDSDVYKALEAIAYSLKNRPNPALEQKADQWIKKIAAAQQPDGYLNTYYTLTDPTKRWTDMSMHEDYMGGHLIEAAVAYFDATGKRLLLDVAIRWADHFASLFGPGKRHWVTGHQGLELALVKLYKTTQNTAYLHLSRWLIDERGHGHAKGYTWDQWKDPGYAQDLVPVKEQKEITGHAVRAMYLYTGAADVASHLHDYDYMQAMKTVWEDVVYRNMYLTGGIGASGRNEGFGVDYDLPNEQAYCETCASVGMVFWNQRMNLLTGESKYIDVLEKSLYNGALDGLSLSGDRFFYGNPLASFGTHSRKEWFGTACCPSNIARLVASLGDYLYAYSARSIWVNLYVGSQVTIPLQSGAVALSTTTNYPWEGAMAFTVNPAKKSRFELRFRLPGWLYNAPAPGDLYRFIGEYTPSIVFKVNGKEVRYQTENGYAVLDREWQKGDVVHFELPMDIKRVTARGELAFNQDRVALQRGPLVYCVEGADNNGKAWNFILPTSAPLRTTPHQVASESVVSIRGEALRVVPSEDGLSSTTQKQTITAIPYYTWCNRGSNEMQVWLPTRIKEVRLNP